MLDQGDILALVLGRADLGPDALCVALVCRAFRDAVFENMPRCGGVRLTTRAGSVAMSISRLIWARGLALAPPWLARWDAATCAKLAGCGNLSVLRWARLRGCVWSHSGSVCATEAARGGHISVLEWLVEHWGANQNFELYLK